MKKGISTTKRRGADSVTDSMQAVTITLGRLLLAVACLTGFYLVVWMVESRTLTEMANLYGPMFLGGSAAFTAYHLVKKEVLVIWTPFFWFLGSIVLFYSLGPLVYVLGGDVLIRYIRSSLPIKVTSIDLFLTNLLNSVGIISVLFGVLLGKVLLPTKIAGKCVARNSCRRIRILAFYLLAIGGLLQFLLILPWEFGAFDFVLPGMVYNLAKLFLFGLMTLAYVVAQGGKRWKLSLYVLWGTQLLIALIHFSKTEVMITMLLPVLGTYMATRNTRKLMYAFLAMAVVYVSIAQMIHFGRYEVVKLSGNLSQATISQRLAITASWFEEGGGGKRQIRSDLSSLETGWARLCYANVQSFAMTRYDMGLPGDTLKTASYVLIPRFFWPEKPITTNISKDFYELVTGWQGLTHLGLGIFGEGYWNFGWPGVILLGITSGVVFWFVGRYAYSWMRQERMEYMPSIFLGISMGLLGTTQFFANAIVGCGGFILFYAFVVSKAFSIALASK